MTEQQSTTSKTFIAVLIGLVVLGMSAALYYWKTRSGENQAKQPPVSQKRTLDQLPLEQRKFVEDQFARAFEYYKAQDFDKTLIEVRKIYAYVDEYKFSRELERYALEGQRRVELLKKTKVSPPVIPKVPSLPTPAPRQVVSPSRQYPKKTIQTRSPKHSVQKTKKYPISKKKKKSNSTPSRKPVPRNNIL